MQLNAAGHAASQVLKERFEAIAQRVTSLYFEAHPLLAPRWKGDRQEFTEDNRRHLAHLGEALFWGRPALFTEYAAWAASLLAGWNISWRSAGVQSGTVADRFGFRTGGAGGSLASQYLDAARAKIEALRLSFPATSGEANRSTFWRATIWRPCCGENGTLQTASSLVRPRAALRSRISTSSSSNARSTS